MRAEQRHPRKPGDILWQYWPWTAGGGEEGRREGHLEEGWEAPKEANSEVLRLSSQLPSDVGIETSDSLLQRRLYTQTCIHMHILKAHCSSCTYAHYG